MQQAPRSRNGTLLIALLALLVFVFLAVLIGCGGHVSVHSIGPQASGGETPRAAATPTATPAPLPLPGDIRVQFVLVSPGSFEFHAAGFIATMGAVNFIQSVTAFRAGTRARKTASNS